jgi:flagellar protein FlgJ
MSAIQATGSGARPSADTPAKIRDAAQQFEALLLTQILRSARESDGGWLRTDKDSASDCASDMADEQLALAMSQRGGFGLADLIATGLTKNAT